MSRPRAALGLVLLPLVAVFQTGLMAATWVWVLLADIVPTGWAEVVREWREP